MSDRIRFDWRTPLSKIFTDLSCAIRNTLHSTVQSALHDDSEWLNKTGVIRSVPVTENLIETGSDRPKQVSAVSFLQFHAVFAS